MRTLLLAILLISSVCADLAHALVEPVAMSVSVQGAGMSLTRSSGMSFAITPGAARQYTDADAAWHDTVAGRWTLVSDWGIPYVVSIPPITLTKGADTATLTVMCRASASPITSKTDGTDCGTTLFSASETMHIALYPVAIDFGTTANIAGVWSGSGQIGVDY